MTRKINLDCPYCHNSVDDVEITIDNPFKVGPFAQICDDCKKEFMYTVELLFVSKEFAMDDAISWNKKN